MTKYFQVKVDKDIPEITEVKTNGYVFGTTSRTPIILEAKGAIKTNNTGTRIGGQSPVTYQYRLGNGEWIDISKDGNESGKITFNNDINANIQFRAIDEAGNEGNPTEEFNMKIKSVKISHRHFTTDTVVDVHESNPAKKDNPAEFVDMKFKVSSEISNIKVVKVWWTDTEMHPSQREKHLEDHHETLEGIETLVMDEDGYYKTKSPRNVEGRMSVVIYAEDNNGNISTHSPTFYLKKPAPTYRELLNEKLTSITNIKTDLTINDDLIFNVYEADTAEETINNGIADLYIILDALYLNGDAVVVNELTPLVNQFPYVDLLTNETLEKPYSVKLKYNNEDVILQGTITVNLIKKPTYIDMLNTELNKLDRVESNTLVNNESKIFNNHNVNVDLKYIDDQTSVEAEGTEVSLELIEALKIDGATIKYIKVNKIEANESNMASKKQKIFDQFPFRDLRLDKPITNDYKVIVEHNGIEYTIEGKITLQLVRDEVIQTSNFVQTFELEEKFQEEPIEDVIEDHIIEEIQEQEEPSLVNEITNDLEATTETINLEVDTEINLDEVVDE